MYRFRNFPLYREVNLDNLALTPVLDRPTLKQGDKDDYVSLLQKELKQLMFYNGAIDGVFGNDTALSVKAFQINNKITADGIVGKNTWSALIYLYAPLTICNENYYIVQKGDTLWSIAKKYETTVDQLKSLNNLTSDALTIGQKIILSGTVEEIPSEGNTFYTVIKGDSLWSIAQKFNTTVDSIKILNNLTSNLLSIGQQLTIPSTSSAVTYTVVKGDSLWSIAQKFNTTVDSIKILNNLTSNLLSIGQILKIKS